jgi:phospholipid/cholesterol/gamma-HCH transport system substrate-binding protein
MRITRRVAINSIAFVVLGMLLAALLAIQVLPTVFGSTYSVYGIFTAAGGVASNQEVTYRGFQIGRVGRMTLTPDAVKIELVIDAGYKVPKDGTRARVLFKSAVGEQFVDLLPESGAAPFFRDGDVIPVEMTSIPIQIEDLLRELNAVLLSIDPKALGSLIHSLGTGLSGHGQDLKDVIKALDVLATVGAQRKSELSGLVSDAADLQDSFNSTREDFVRAIASLRTVLATLAANKDDLSRTVAAARELNGQIIELLDARRPELEKIVADLGTVVRLTDANLGDVDKLLTYLGPMLNDVDATFDAPYFIFNLNTNTEAPECSYDPSGRPGGSPRSVLDDSPRSPPVNISCPGDPFGASAGFAQAATRSRLEQVSWLRLLTAGF